MALPVSAGYQARLDQANAGIAGLPSIYDPRRKGSAFDYAAQLNDSGYTRNLMPSAVTNAQGTAYQFGGGQDGRIYAQSARGINDSLNARGAYWSSFNVRAQQEQRAQLDAARNAIMRQAAAAQQGLTDQQGEQLRSYEGDLSTARGEYADWQSQQQALADEAARSLAAQNAAQTPAASSAPAQGNPLIGVNGAWGTTYQQPGPLAGINGAWGTTYKPPPKVTYAKWLNGRTSTAALAAQWRKLYGG